MTRNRIAEKVYLDSEGNESKHAHAEAVALVIKFANGESVTVDPSELGNNVLKAASLHGLSQTIGDSYSGADDVATAMTLATSRLETLKQGNWTSVSEGGGSRVTILAEALHRAKADKYPTLQDAVAAVGEWDKDRKKDARKLLQKQIAEIEAERAQQKAQKAETDEDALDQL